ncbi:MAG: hypothetical protein JNL32_06460 [Candidatus Kapabacteria bacterium]|nr:hypothetical protein [Candidatus Kapabacteria bacterium]
MADGLTVTQNPVKDIDAGGFPKQTKGMTVASGQNLVAGQIVAVPRVGAIAAPAAVAGNTGNGTVTGTITAGARAVPGTYRVTCIATATNGGLFAIVAPNGEHAGHVRVGVAFTGSHLAGLTINDSTTDFALGDAFTITVAAGNNKCVAYNAAQPHDIVGVLAEDTNATSADTPATIITAANLLRTGLTGYTDALETPLRLLNLFVKESY